MDLREMSFAFVDVETTGGNAVRERVIEIAVIIVEENEIQRTWSTLLHPERSIPSMISAITGITNGDIEVAPTFASVADELLGLLEGRIFVAHNARFDYAFVKNEFRRLEMEWSAKTLCTVRLSRALFPRHRSHSLDQLIERHGFACSSRHRALDDIKVVTDFWFEMQKQRGEEQFSWCIDSLLKRPSLPSHLLRRSVENLPESTGVYLFYGKGDRPFYIGKSVDIRSRVLAHFAGDHQQRKDLEMSQRLRRIEVRETVGELGALLLEACLIKEHAPLYNVALRGAARQCTIRLETHKNSFDRIVFVPGRDVRPEEFPHLYGVFHSEASARERMAELMEAYSLCPRVLGIEHSGSGQYCFGYHLKKCRGACGGEETAAEHNLRLRLALSSLKHTAWPFEGMIGVREAEIISGRADIHLIDQWCYLGTARTEDELQEILSCPRELHFDIDHYRIIAGFLRTMHSRKRQRSWTIEIIEYGSVKRMRQITTKPHLKQSRFLAGASLEDQEIAAFSV